MLFLPSGGTHVVRFSYRKQLSFTIAVNDSTHSFWIVRSYGDADLLCAGKAQPVVHLCLRFRLCAGFRLWLSARCVAVWRGRSRVVSSGVAPLVDGAGPTMSVT
jgi:hypothetical protein